MAKIQLVRNRPTFTEFIRTVDLTPNDFGITYVRWPYDPAVSGGEFTSQNPSRWQTELDSVVGWIRTFDPNLYGRHSGGSFVQVGTSAEGSPKPYGRIEGGTWYKGMLKSNGQYDFSKLDLLISSAKQKNLKVLMMIGGQGAYFDATNNRYIEYPLPTGEFWSTNSEAYSRRFLDFMEAFLTRCGNDIHAIEIANESAQLVRLNTVVGPGYTEQLTVCTRIVKQLVQQKGLNILVCSPPMQGGESGEITSFLTTSAAGINLFGVNGTGTTGRNWIDVVCHHAYGAFSERGGGGSTATMDAAGINDVNADGAYPNNTLFSFAYAAAAAVKSGARLGGWTGPLWNCEFNMTGQVDSSLWYPRKMTQSGLERTFEQLLVSSILCGYDKHIIYAPDHPTLGFYDENVGTIPADEPGTWWFKAPNNTARGATALATVIRRLVGRSSFGVRAGSTIPFYSQNRKFIRESTTATSGRFVEKL